MRRAALVALAPFALLLLAGCHGEEKDYGKEITASSDLPKVDVDAEVSKIQANEHMPAAAKEAAIANLRRGQATASGQSAAKTAKK